MNRIEKIIKNLNDDELREAINEMKEDETNGSLRSGGHVMRISSQIHDATAEPVSSVLFMTQMGLLKEAAYRFSK